MSRAASVKRAPEQEAGEFVPRKIKELVAELETRRFRHAKHYQVRAMKRAIEESKS